MKANGLNTPALVSALRADLEPHLSRLRVAVYGSGGAPAHHLALLALWGGAPAVIFAEEIASGALERYDAVIFPGGGLAAMTGQLRPLGPAGMAALRGWVEAGGCYLGSCAGACHPLHMSPGYTQANPGAELFQICEVTPLNAAAGAWGLASPGTGRLRVAPEPDPLFDGLGKPFELVHYNGPLFPEHAGSLGRVLEGTDHFTPFETSYLKPVAPSGDARGEVFQLTTLGQAIAQGARVAYRQRVGAGQVIVFGSHPEFGGSALQLGWLPSVRLLANALRLVPIGAAAATTTSQPTALQPLAHTGSAVLTQPWFEGTLWRLEQLALLLQEGAAWAARLPADTPSFLGLSGAALWNAALGEAQELLGALGRWLTACPVGGEVRGLWLLDTEPRATQDVGFMGLLQLLGAAQALAEQAVDPAAAWPPFTGPYDQLGAHPFHLLVGSYLSACGLIAAAALQASAFTALSGLPLPHPVSLKLGA